MVCNPRRISTKGPEKGTRIITNHRRNIDHTVLPRLSRTSKGLVLDCSSKEVPEDQGNHLLPKPSCINPVISTSSKDPNSSEDPEKSRASYVYVCRYVSITTNIKSNHSIPKLNLLSKHKKLF